MKNYCRANILAEKLNISESCVWRWVALGKLPQPFRPTKRSSLFDMEECQKAIDKMAGGKV